MKKALMLVLLAATAIVSVDAQENKPLQFGLGVNLVFPSKDFKYSSSFGAGVRAQLEVPFGEQISGLATASFNRLFYKESVRHLIDETGINVIPLQVGARFYPISSVFAGIQAGYGIFAGGGDIDGGFSFNPHVGFNAEQFQLILGYNSVSRDGAYSWVELGGVIKL